MRWSRALPIHSGLAGARRSAALGPTVTDHASPAEVLTLLLVGGAAAALSVLLDLDLRVPGHAVLRAIFPMALGLALVPRRNAGAVMGLGAGAAVLVLLLLGRGTVGAGATTSLLCTGPLLDLAVRRAGSAGRVRIALVLAGTGANVLALAVRTTAKLAGGVGKPLAVWLPQASITYALCGAAAGLVSAMVWFRLGERD